MTATPHPHPWLAPDGTRRPTVSVETAAEYLGRSTRHVRRLIRDGVIPAWQLTPGGPWAVDREWLLGPAA